jgi:hypothetical protein
MVSACAEIIKKLPTGHKNAKEGLCMRNKLFVSALLVCLLVLGLTLVGCPTETSDDDDGNGNVSIESIVVEGYAYRNFHEVMLTIDGYSPHNGDNYVWKDDFKLYLNDEAITLYSVFCNYGSVSDGKNSILTTSFFLYFASPTITTGTNYKVKVDYTPNTERPIHKDGVSTGQPLEGFETERSLAAKES